MHSTWRIDETYITVRGEQAFFWKAFTTSLPRWPRKLILDGHTPSHRALRLLRREDPKWKYVVVRSCKYLNNIVEQDHRAIKRRCASMTGFKFFHNAAVTLSGIELGPAPFPWTVFGLRCGFVAGREDEESRIATVGRVEH